MESVLVCRRHVIREQYKTHTPRAPASNTVRRTRLLYSSSANGSSIGSGLQKGWLSSFLSTVHMTWLGHGFTHSFAL